MSQTKEIVYILDRSGSMNSIRQDVIGGFNGFIEEQRKLSGKLKDKVNFTLVLFDHEYEVPIEGKELLSIAPISRDDFVPRGSTAMYDAIGRAISETKQRISLGTPVLVVIHTDGYENASEEWNQKQVFDLIQEQTDWEFLYLGANQDAMAVGGSMGLSSHQTMNYDANKQGMQVAYAAVSRASTGFRTKTQKKAVDMPEVEEVP